MDILNFSEQSTKEIFKTMFELRNLILVSGAGFSRGATAKNGKVPSGEELKSIMISMLKEKLGDAVEKLEDNKFPEVAEHFLNPDFVESEKVKKVLENYFTSVVLPENKRNFLKCPWPYIYTFNIDDSIENNSKYRTKILPNRVLSDGVKNSMPTVFKIHGDAAEEILYDEPSKIIFSTEAYVRSLTSNYSMLNSIKTDLVESNVLFVGCSLDYEIDLLYALAEYQGEFPPSRKSIYLTRKEPDVFESARLKKYGINTILIVDSYDDFYEELSKIESNVIENQLSYFDVSGKLSKLKNERERNFGLLMQTPDISEKFTLPYFYTNRDVGESLYNSSQKSVFSLLRGRRFSGKSLLLKNIALTTKFKKVYLFSSNETASEELIPEILKVKNSLLIFDTNTLTANVAQKLGASEKIFAENGTSLIIAVNRTEPEITGALARYISEESDFDLSNRLLQNEFNELNSKLDSLGIIKFERSKTLLDNTFRLIKKYENTSSYLLKEIEVSDAEVELLLVIAISDKAYTSLATALNIRINDIFNLCDRFSPILEYTETSKTEQRATGSKYKITTNSKIGLSYQFSKMIDKNGHSWLSARFESIVAKLLILPKFKNIANSMYMFDSINYVLTQGALGASKTGFRPVVRQVYENLQPLLNDSSDYWLQRAKATLNVDDDEKSIIEGIEFGMKALIEAERDRTIDNAEFTVALLYGKLCFVTDYKNVKYIIQAVLRFSEAIRNYHRNPDYIQRIVDESSHHKSYFSHLCSYLEGVITEPNLLEIQTECSYMLKVRESWKWRK